MEDLCFAVLDTSTFCSLRQELDKLWSSPPPPRSRYQLCRLSIRGMHICQYLAALHWCRYAAKSRLLPVYSRSRQLQLCSPNGAVLAWVECSLHVRLPCRRRVKSTRRQLQLQQFADQQQQLAAERAAKWGRGLIRRLQQRLSLKGPWQPNSSSSSSESPGSSDASAAAIGASSNSSSADAGSTIKGPQPQHQRTGGLNLLLHGLWSSGSSATAAAGGASAAAGGQGLLPAPPMSQADITVEQAVTSHEEPKRPSGADWGVTDAALSLRSLLGSSLGSLGSSSISSGMAVAPAADAAKPADPSANSSSDKPSKGQLSAQQQQLRNILSTVVPFDAVSLTSSNPGLTWSAQQGLSVLKEAASRLYNELAVGSFSGGLKVEIQGRLKSLRSVHNKMERKNCSVEVGRDYGC